jgi:hypothetical protein
MLEISGVRKSTKYDIKQFMLKNKIANNQNFKK